LCKESAGTRTTLVVKADNRSGRLVRSVIVAPKVVSPGEPDRPEPAAAVQSTNSLSDMIDSIAAKLDVEGLWCIRSSRRRATTIPGCFAKGAQGLMQLIPATAKRFGVSNTFNAEQNIEGGVKYLKFLMSYITTIM